MFVGGATATPLHIRWVMVIGLNNMSGGEGATHHWLSGEAVGVV